MQAVDGVVHAHGGCGLRKALTAATPAPTVPSCHLSCRSTNGHSSLDTLPTAASTVAAGLDSADQTVRCAEGDAVVTAGNYGTLDWDLIAHSVPPFWPGEQMLGGWAELLGRCYASSLNELVCSTMLRAEPASSGLRPALWVAAPLLGAGARGAPTRAAAGVAVSQLCSVLLTALEEERADELGQPRLSRAMESMMDLRFRLVVQQPDVQSMVCAAVDDAVGDEILCGRLRKETVFEPLAT